VDLEAGAIDVYRLAAGRYGRPQHVGPGDHVSPGPAPDIVVDVGAIVGAPQRGAG
jgi:hypothetical protein